EGGAIIPPPLLALASFFVCRSRSFRVLAVGFGSRSFFSAKPSEIFCHWLEARLVASKFSTIVLGGTAASHTCSGVGGGHFLIKKSGDRFNPGDKKSAGRVFARARACYETKLCWVRY